MKQCGFSPPVSISTKMNIFLAAESSIGTRFKFSCNRVVGNFLHDLIAAEQFLS